MTLKHEFYAHRLKTVEAFKFVRADIANTNLSLEQLKGTINSVGMALSSVNQSILEMKELLEKNSIELSSHKQNDLRIESKLNLFDKSYNDLNSEFAEFRASLNDSVTELSNALNSAENSIDSVRLQSNASKRRLSSSEKILKKLLPKSKTQGAKLRKVSSGLRISQEDIEKLKRFFNGKLKSVKRANLELEDKLKIQKKRIVKLNKKIDEGKPTKPKKNSKSAKKKLVVKKTVISKVKTVKNKAVKSKKSKSKPKQKKLETVRTTTTTERKNPSNNTVTQEKKVVEVSKPRIDNLL